MNKTVTLCVLLALCTMFSQAQEKLSGHIYGSYLVPFNDFTQSNYEGYKANLGVGASLGYQLIPTLRLRGDIASGLLNGNDDVNYYETTVYEGQLGLDFNVLRLFMKEYEGVKVNIQGGVGMMMYAARLYNQTTGAKVIESPIRTERSFSPNAILTYGLNVGIPLSKKLDLNLGYTNRWTDNVDWMDGQRSGNFTDTYGMASLGLVFYLKSDKDKSKIEIDRKDLDRLIATRDSLGKEAEVSQSSKERVAELEMTNQEKTVRIAQLEAEKDTLIARLEAETDTAIPAPVPTPADAEAILAREQYRLVVASLPTESMAQRWIDKSKLDKAEMVIAFIEELNTYRVVYRSFESYPAARKELLNIKMMVSDAWIIKF